MSDAVGIRHCRKCGAAILDGSLFCHACGTEREKCSCGEFMDANMVYCPKCNKPCREQQKHNEEWAEFGKIWSSELTAKANFIDRGDWIELKNPIFNIRMIRKTEALPGVGGITWSSAMSAADYYKYQLPTFTELMLIYKLSEQGIIKIDHPSLLIRPFYGSIPRKLGYWSSDIASTDGRTDGAWWLCFKTGFSYYASRSERALVRWVKYDK